MLGRWIKDNAGMERIRSEYVFLEGTGWFILWISFDFQIDLFLFQTPGGERWYVNNVELIYSSNNNIFEHIDRPGLDVKLSTPPGTLLFPTPVGKAYTCDQEVIITMFAQVWIQDLWILLV